VAADHHSRASGYRLHMHECVMAALVTHNKGIRSAMLDLAFDWGRLAKQSERMEPALPSREDLQGVRVLVIKPRNR
jgi:hypothetical protein